MNNKQHAALYAVMMVIFIALTYDELSITWELYLAMMIGYIIVNPDVDQIIPRTHRNFLTHSALFPIAIYWGLHPFWNLATIDSIAWVLFFPCIVHLLGDMNLVELFDIDLTEEQKKEHNQDFGGMWQIWCCGKRMGKNGSLIWLTLNIVGMFLYAFSLAPLW